MNGSFRHPWVFPALLALAACGQDQALAPVTAGADVAQAEQPLEPFYEQRLAARQVDYFRALRIASLKLRASLPTLAEIRELQNANTPSQKYAELVDRMLSQEAALPQVMDFWRNTLVLDAPPNPNIGVADKDAAVVYAAMITLSSTMPFGNLFTAPSDQCWTLNAQGAPTVGTCRCSAGGTAAGGATDCFNGNAPNAGIIGNPAFMAMNYGSMAFHRIRMVQEIFVCRPMPAEPSGAWDAVYTPPLGGIYPSTPIEFSSSESVICANCHQTINRQATIFGNFDMTGVLRDRAGLKLGNRACASPPDQCDYEVHVPISGAPPMKMSDVLRLVDGVPVIGWRANAPATNLSQLGSAMAADPEVARCLLSRMWYWLMSRKEVSTDPVRPPATMTQDWVAVLNSSTDPVTGNARTPGTLRGVLLSMLTSDDFVRF